MLLRMGLRELRAIQTVQDLQAYQPEELLKVIQGAIQEVDTRMNELEQKLNWATQQIALLTHRLFGNHSEKTPKDEVLKDEKSVSEKDGEESERSDSVDQKPKKPKKAKV